MELLLLLLLSVGLLLAVWLLREGARHLHAGLRLLLLPTLHLHDLLDESLPLLVSVNHELLGLGLQLHQVLVVLVVPGVLLSEGGLHLVDNSNGIIQLLVVLLLDWVLLVLHHHG